MAVVALECEGSGHGGHWRREALSWRHGATSKQRGGFKCAVTLGGEGPPHRLRSSRVRTPVQAARLVAVRHWHTALA